MSRFIALALAAASLAPGAALADTCGEAFTRSSRSMAQGKLVEARAELRTCAAASCPATMRPLCTRDLAALETRVPSVVVVDRQDPDVQRDAAVVVRVDGAVLEDRLDGRARDVDPGQHTFRFERAGREPIEQRVLIAEGEKRSIEIAWVADGHGAPAGQAVGNAIPAPDASRPIPASAWITGGLGAAAAITWAATGIDGLEKKADLSTCKAGGCPHDQVQTTQTLLNVADLAAGTTLALAVVTAVLVLTRPSVAAQVTTSASGGEFFLGGRF